MYDFSGEPGTAELSITAGEILTVTRENVGDGWCEGHNQHNKSGLFPAAYVQAVETPTSVSQSTGDYWDDDWDDDSEVGQTQAYVPTANLQSHISGQSSVDNAMQHVHSVIPERTIPNVPKKNNKFSTLIKSGEDSFLLGNRAVPVPDMEKVFIEETEDGRCVWLATGEKYCCVITSPKKESKLKGLKSFIVYQLTPTVRDCLKN